MKGILAYRAKSRSMAVLRKGFIFVGIDYSGTRPQDNTEVSHANEDSSSSSSPVHSLLERGGVKRLLILKNMGFPASFLIQERCAKQGCKYSRWSGLTSG